MKGSACYYSFKNVLSCLGKYVELGKHFVNEM